MSRESRSSHHDGAAAIPLGAEALEYKCAAWRIGLRRASSQCPGAIRLAAYLPEDARLTAGGFVSEAEERFTITELVPLVTLSSIRNSGLQAGRRVASKFLRAEEWTPERNIRDPRNQVVYEGLTDERLHAAEREYRRRLKSTER